MNALESNREGALTYARHIRAAVPAFTAMMSPLLNPNNTKPLADSTGCVTIVAPRAELCSSTCSCMSNADSSQLRLTPRWTALRDVTAVVIHTCCPVAALSFTRVPSRDPMYANIPVDAIKT